MGHSENLKPPQPGISDHVYQLAHLTAGVLPVFGSTIQTILEIFGPPIDRRKEVWCEQMADAVRRLQSEYSVSVDALASDPTFVDIVVRITDAAIRTSEQKKHQALQNALINAGASIGVDQEQRIMFIRFVAELQDVHIGVLELFRDPIEWFRRHGKQWPSRTAGGHEDTLRRAFPELAEREYFVRQVWRDLRTRGLVELDDLGGTVSGAALGRCQLSSFGVQFLKFISEPMPDRQQETR